MRRYIELCFLCLLTNSFTAFAATVDDSKVTNFESGTLIQSSAVNANFQALISAINDNAAEIAALKNAATDSSVEGNTYKVFALHVTLGNDDNTPEDSTNSATFANISNGTQNFTINFGSNGSGTWIVDLDTEAELTLPGYNLSKREHDAPGTSFPFAYSQSGATVTLTFNAGTADAVSVNWTVSGDGSALMSLVNELEQIDWGDNPATPGYLVWTQFLVGMRQ